MQKKVIAVLMAGAMALGILSGCGNAEGDEKVSQESNVSKTEESTSETEESSSSSQEKEEPVTVVWWAAGDESEDHDMVMEELNKLLVEKINVKLDLQITPYGEFPEKVKLASTAGEDFDLVWTSDWSNNYLENIAREAFLPLNDLVAEYGQDIVDALPGSLLDVTKTNGNIYAIPNLQILYTQSGAYILKEYAEKYNMDMTHVNDISELYPFLDQIVENEPKMIPLEVAGFTPIASNSYEKLASGNVFVDRDGNLVSTVEAMEEEWRARNEWYQKGYIREDVLTVTDNSAYVKDHRIVCYLSSPKPGGDVEMSIRDGVDYVMLSIGDPYLTSNAGVGTMTALNVNSKNPEAAMKLLNLVYSDKEVFNMLIFGLEGVHYNWVDETHIKVVENVKYTLPAWMFGNQFNAYLTEGQQDGVWEETAKINNEAIPSPLTGFVFDASNVQAEYANLGAVAGEYNNGEYVAEDIEAWIKERNDKSKIAGSDAIIAEMQRQVDEWKAANK